MMEKSEHILASGVIAKADDDRHTVFGWAYVVSPDGQKQTVDKSGDFISLDDVAQLEDAAYEFVVNSRDGGDWHDRRGVSTMVESMVFTPEKIQKMGLPEATPVGWWCGFHVTDEAVWNKVKSGIYKSFSIHGSGVRKEVD